MNQWYNHQAQLVAFLIADGEPMHQMLHNSMALKRRVCFHEAGHAVMLWFTTGCWPTKTHVSYLGGRCVPGCWPQIADGFALFDVAGIVAESFDRRGMNLLKVWENADYDQDRRCLAETGVPFEHAAKVASRILQHLHAVLVLLADELLRRWNKSGAMSATMTCKSMQRLLAASSSALAVQVPMQAQHFSENRGLCSGTMGFSTVSGPPPRAVTA